jgi:hypothetical protein
MLPHEGHGYLARESVMHVLAEELDWLERWLGPRGDGASGDGAEDGASGDAPSGDGASGDGAEDGASGDGAPAEAAPDGSQRAPSPPT